MKLPSLHELYLRRLVVSPKSVSMELGGLRQESGVEQPISYDVQLVFSGVTSVHLNGCFRPGTRITGTTGFGEQTEQLGARTYSLDVDEGHIAVSSQQLVASAYVFSYGDASSAPG